MVVVDPYCYVLFMESGFVALTFYVLVVVVYACLLYKNYTVEVGVGDTLFFISDGTHHSIFLGEPSHHFGLKKQDGADGPPSYCATCKRRLLLQLPPTIPNQPRYPWLPRHLVIHGRQKQRAVCRGH